VFYKTTSDEMLCKGYTGAYLGAYSTANGFEKGDYADFDFITCRFFPDRIY